MLRILIVIILSFSYSFAWAKKPEAKKDQTNKNAEEKKNDWLRSPYDPEKQQQLNWVYIKKESNITVGFVPGKDVDPDKTLEQIIYLFANKAAENENNKLLGFEFSDENNTATLNIKNINPKDKKTYIMKKTLRRLTPTQSILLFNGSWPAKLDKEMSKEYKTLLEDATQYFKAIEGKNTVEYTIGDWVKKPCEPFEPEDMTWENKNKWSFVKVGFVKDHEIRKNVTITESINWQSDRLTEAGAEILGAEVSDNGESITLSYKMSINGAEIIGMVTNRRLQPGLAIMITEGFWPVQLNKEMSRRYNLIIDYSEIYLRSVK